MPKLALNAKVVKNLKPPAKDDKPNQVDYWDTVHSAFGLRLSYNGAKTWMVAVRVGGGPVRRKIGRYPVMSLAEARKRAEEVQEAARHGVDPKELERVEARKRRAEQISIFGAVRDQFVKEYRKKGRELRTMAEYERALKAEDFREWENRTITSITTDDVEELLAGMVKAGTGIKANRTLSYLQTLFKWAKDGKLLNGRAIPTDGVKPPAANVKRERVLTGQEIHVIWDALDDVRVVGVFGPLIKLLLLTGVRKEEAGGMEWRELSDLHGEEPIWDVPKERMKMDRRHRVFLSATAVKVLSSVPKDFNLVFSTTGKTPLSGHSRVKARLDARIAEICEREKFDHLFNEGWTIHDFRRAFTTHLRDMGVPGDVLDLCLHHKRPGVNAFYDWAELPIERRAAMDIWSEYLSRITEKQLNDGAFAQLKREMRKKYHDRIRGEE